MTVPHQKYNHAFSLITSERTYVFVCDSDEQRVEWVSHLIEALKVHQADVEEDKTGDYMNFENVKEFQKQKKAEKERSVSLHEGDTTTSPHTHPRSGSTAASHTGNEASGVLERAQSQESSDGAFEKRDLCTALGSPHF